jgi:hypothetical protein
MLLLFQLNYSQSQPVTLPLGPCVVAADKEVVIARQERSLYHDLAVHHVERLYDPHVGKLALNLFSE